MKSFCVTNSFPSLYLDKENQFKFSLPLNISAVLLSLNNEEFKPIFISSSMLNISKKSYYKRMNIKQNLRYLIESGFIPNFIYSDFVRCINEVRFNQQSISFEFSEKKRVSNYDERISAFFKARFLPLFNNKRKNTHILFFLEGVQGEEQENKEFYQLDIVKNIKSHEVKFKEIIQIFPTAVIHLDSNLNVLSYNKKILEIFPKLKDNLNFLSLWSSNNRNDLKENIAILKYTKTEEVILFENTKNGINKLKVVISILSEIEDQHSFIVSIEDLSGNNFFEKELTRKSIFLQSIHDLSNEIENDNEFFVNLYAKKIISLFQFNDMVFIPFFETSDSGYLYSFLDGKKLDISDSEYEKLLALFKPLKKKVVKKYNSELFKSVFDSYLNVDSISLFFAVPIYQNDIQIGIVIYTSGSKNIKLDESYLLYSLTVITFRFYMYKKLNNMLLD